MSRKVVISGFEAVSRNDARQDKSYSWSLIQSRIYAFDWYRTIFMHLIAMQAYVYL